MNRKIQNYVIGPDADLRNAVLRGADLRYCDLRNADLRNAVLRNADLRGADLRYCNLRNAVLRNADLRGADLRYCNLRKADLRNADLRNADLRGADLNYTCLPLSCGGQSAKIDNRIARQLLSHALSFVVEKDDKTYEAIKAFAKSYCAESHIAKHMEWLKGGENGEN